MKFDMSKKFGTETKVGLFALGCLIIIAFATIKVGDRSIVAGGGYRMTVTMDSAIGIKTKTPVEIAGIQVGVIKKIALDENSKAKVVLLINSGVKLPEGTIAYVRSKGFLGETYIELRPGPMVNQPLAKKAEIPYGGVTGDVNFLLSQFNEIASDIKSVTGSLKGMVGSDDTSPVYRAVNNLDEFTQTMRDLTVKNETNMNKVIQNLAALTSQLRGVIERSSYDVEQAMAGLSNITRKVDEGHGTIGKLINDEATVNKINDAVDNLNDTLGGIRKLETEIGYHMEYLGGTNEYKHYVHLGLKPSPDKAFLFDFISDPSGSPTRVTRTTDIVAGGTTSTVETHSATVDQDKFRFSAQLAKKFYNFTLRGGVIESTGGVGLDYGQGPVGVQFSAFDFDTKYGQEPHLKVLGNLNITKSLYLVGGVDDFINPNQPKDWFFGAGVRLVDEDIKSLFGVASKAFK